MIRQLEKKNRPNRKNNTKQKENKPRRKLKTLNNNFNNPTKKKLN